MVALAILVAACGSADPDRADGRSPLDGPAATISSAPAPGSGPNPTAAGAGSPPAALDRVECPAPLRRDDGAALSCGVATVQLDRSDTSSTATTEVSVAAVEGSAAEQYPPLVVLQGGPGGASSELAAWFPQQPFTQIFVDQRGTGFAGPSLDCTEFDDHYAERVLAADSPTGAERSATATATCARRLEELGFAPLIAHTNSAAHAADVIDIMTTLHYEQWLVYGVSYGTTIGLEILRADPSDLAGVILDGVYPPDVDVDEGLAESAARGPRSARCRSAGPMPRGREITEDASLTATLDRVIGSYDDDPLVVSIPADEEVFPMPSTWCSTGVG
ncbi:MAG: alpha/beta hydrolase [Acidimicrobiales bacterium]